MCHKLVRGSVWQISTPLGNMALEASETALLRAWFPPQKLDSPDIGCTILKVAEEWFNAYFSGERPDVTALPLQPAGTAYQQSIWREMLRIPYGETRAYGDLCRHLAASGLPPGSPRAAGAAVARNPIAIVIPCHRVLGSTGKLVGFAGGLWRKEWLLAHERTLSQPSSSQL